MATPIDHQTAEELSGRVFGAVLGALDTWAIYVGDKFGLYDLLAQGPSTQPKLKCDERHAQPLSNGMVRASGDRRPAHG
jgi:hypothetical protein